MSPKRLLARGRQFFEDEIWATNLDGAPWDRVLAYRLSRALYATVRGFLDKDLSVRAASLTYYSMLSVVPFLAFAFSLLKGFGLYHTLMQTAVRPYIAKTFAGDDALLKAIDQILSFVEHTNVSGLSIIGVLFLVYTSVSMLSSVESAFNGIWEARARRTTARRITDYTTMMVIGPLLIVAAIAFSTAAQNSSLVEKLRESWLGGIVNFAFGLTSLTLVTSALVALYTILPNVRTRFRSVLGGGLIAGLLWQGLLVLQVKFQIGVAKYNALYSGFAAVPIFVVWVDLSWIIVLVGAQLAASHQYERRYKQEVRAQHVDQELKESLAVAAAAAVGRRFMDGRPPLTCAELAAALGVPPPPVQQVLDALVGAGVLVRVVDEDGTAYDPARDVDTLRITDLEGAVRHDSGAQVLKQALEGAVGGPLGAVLRARHAEAARDTGALTLRELARQSAIDGVGVDGLTPPIRPGAGGEAAAAPKGRGHRA